jgi:hypothetical protein
MDRRAALKYLSPCTQYFSDNIQYELFTGERALLDSESQSHMPRACPTILDIAWMGGCMIGFLVPADRLSGVSRAGKLNGGP